MPACPTLFRTPSHYRLGSDAQSVLRVLPNRLPFHSLSFLVKPSPLIHTSASIAVGIPKNDLRFPCALENGVSMSRSFRSRGFLCFSFLSVLVSSVVSVLVDPHVVLHRVSIRTLS